MKKITTKEYTEIIWNSYPITDLKLNALGLCGEAGEFANKVKQRTYKEVPSEDLLDELGDVLWHVAQCAKILGSDIDTLMEISVAKTLKKGSEKI